MVNVVTELVLNVVVASCHSNVHMNFAVEALGSFLLPDFGAVGPLTPDASLIRASFVEHSTAWPFSIDRTIVDLESEVVHPDELDSLPF